MCLLALSSVLVGCGGFGSSNKNADENVVLKWDEALLQAIRDTSPGPPATARAIGIVHTAMFDAWAAYDDKAVGTQLGGALRRPIAERNLPNKEVAVSYAAYRALVDLFPSEKPKFDMLMRETGMDPTISALDSTPAGIGNQAAKAVIAYRHNDGSNQLNGYADTTGYTPVNTVDTINDPNRWQPLKFSNGKTPGFIAPHWGQVKTFAVTNGAALRAPQPVLHPDPAYKTQAEEIVSLTANLTDKQKIIAEYWANGPRTELPPGHWALFGQYVSRRDGHTLDDDVKMFFILGNALLDSSICCWESKRFYDYCRPITAIRFLFKGQTIQGWGGPGKGTVSLDGGDWIPYQPSTFITPPFAEYTSGHSTFSAAGAEILKRFTGSDNFGASAVFPPGSSATEPGVTPKQTVTLRWNTFSEAADEAGISRRYGGIHFEAGDLNARAMGRSIGTAVWNKAQTYINGS